jgi:hypothetical protein
MVRGYQKRVIYLKNTRSRHFDEAYFVVKEDSTLSGVPHGELVEEANRIIDENYLENEKATDKGRFGKALHILGRAVLLLLYTLLPFSLGIAVCVLFM